MSAVEITSGLHRQISTVCLTSGIGAPLLNVEQGVELKTLLLVFDIWPLAYDLASF